MRYDVRRACALALILAGTALAACGDDDEPEPAASPEATATQQAQDTPEAPAGGETLGIDATEGDSGLGFDPAELSAPAGTVTIEMANPEGNQLPHAVELEGNGIEEVGETVQAGGTSTVTAEVEAGEYTFYCPVGDHRAGGMEGTLTVQ